MKIINTKIFILNDGARVGSTKKAFDIIEDKELMRAWTLSFNIANTNPIQPLINQKSMFEVDDQFFDIYSLQTVSGTENITTVQALHASYRLNDYILQPQYSKLGTIREIAQELLEQSVNANGVSASAEFELGNIRSSQTIAFSLGNEEEVTLRSALLGLQEIGVEVAFDNFTIHLPERIGVESGKTFRFGKDLISFRRNWSKDNGATYEVSYADLNRVSGAEPEDVFSLGDMVTVDDKMVGESVTRRIVNHTKCHDNPANDTITLGVFVRDSATNAVQMQADIDMKLTEGEAYNSVRINRNEGFVAEADVDGANVQVKMNAQEGFAIYVDGAKRNWIDTAGLIAQRMSNDGSGQHYFFIGTAPNGFPGSGFVVRGEEYITIWPDAGNYGHFDFNNPGDINFNTGGSISFKKESGTIVFHSTGHINFDGGSGNIFFNVPGQITYTGNSTYSIIMDNSGISFKKNGVTLERWS